MNFKWAGLLCALFLFGACTGSNDKSNLNATIENNDGVVSERVIYGVDNRIDVYQENDVSWRELARSTVALMEEDTLTSTAAGYNIAGIKYGTSQMLCKAEPFYEQNTAAFCSGSLIAPDLIMTAGHCVRSQSACEGIKFVFDFAYRTQGIAPSSVGKDDVYSCKELIHSELNNSTMSDYSLVRLDRPVVGRKPLTVRIQGKVAVGDPLTVIGHPSGLPTKIAEGANVRDASSGPFFVANLDTYGGNSGSAVFNSDTGVVEGILVRGATDFVYKQLGDCYMSNKCPSGGCRGEDVTRVSEIFNSIDPSELAQPVAGN